ncbi:hypothetical protein HYH03_015193 [Edaphochlamys debaryana]|uniref:TLC domain-containing protein n=1 Tax=Edaphochlamys debaryana TaxID=47281 RepID=A0A835XNM5_9CHLO|nr:hypothetical protein HYH03_015193 [Edaphochlamys debaryana]|eukprot:KAG2486098.1 hypothetical protein HYH03_015193 [Edaphochlamys debaryana]
MGANELVDIAVANAPFLLPALGFTVVWLVVRVVFYAGLRAYFKSLPATSRLKVVALQEKVLEESFAIVGALVATWLGYQAFQYSDAGSCGFLNQTACFSGWPGSVGPRAQAITTFHTVELGWYLHYLAKHHMGIGMVDNLQMALHHFSTITLLLMSFLLNLHRAGVLVLFLLNLSNPFLHVAKVTHYVEAKADKMCFVLFALAFFLSRIVAYPLVVLKGTLFDSFRAEPSFLDPRRYLAVYLTANGLLLLLMGMQIQWFMGIIRLVRQAVGGSHEDFKKEGKVHDYAKTQHEGQTGAAGAGAGGKKDE